MELSPVMPLVIGHRIPHRGFYLLFADAVANHHEEYSELVVYVRFVSPCALDYWPDRGVCCHLERTNGMYVVELVFLDTR